MDWDKIRDEFDELDYDEIVARVEDNVEILNRGDKVLGEALALMIWQIADNTGFAIHILDEATNIIRATEARLHAELRQCIEEVVEGYIEFETGELRKRLDRSIDRQNKRLENQDRSIDHLNEWRNRSERKGNDSS